LFQECLQLVDLVRNQFQLELTHKQCDAAVQVAARDGRWADAALLYSNHIDPDAAGYLPVVTTTATAGDRSTVSGLYCIARAAMEAGTLPVESVLDGVLKLSLVSPTDTENCTCFFGSRSSTVYCPVLCDSCTSSSFFALFLPDVLAAGVALGHAGEWEALRNYLKSSYKSSQLGQVRCCFRV
jgi:hypothetical protein